MKLYFTDSKGKKILVKEDISDYDAVFPEILNHMHSRFVYPKGNLKIHQVETYFTFTDKKGKDVGYILEK